MVEDRIRNIEARVQASSDLPDTAKAELLDLLAAMRAELEGVENQHLQSAASAAEVHHGETLDDALGALTQSMTALEATHPRLANLANRLAVALANMGI